MNDLNTNRPGLYEHIQALHYSVALITMIATHREYKVYRSVYKHCPEDTLVIVSVVP